MNKPLLIIPTFISKPEHLELLEVCLESIGKTTKVADVLIVDDGSPFCEDTDESDLQKLSESHGVQVHFKPDNSGFSKTVNVGLQRCLEEKRDAVLVNQDIQFTHTGWLDEMANTEGDIIGAQLVYSNGVIQHGGCYFSSIARNFDHRFKGCVANQPEANEPCDCPVTGALQYIKYETLEEIGLYDEDYFLGYEDMDYCIRALKERLRSVYNPKVKAIHHESIIRRGISSQEQGESYWTFVRKNVDTNFFDLHVPSMMS